MCTHSVPHPLQWQPKLRREEKIATAWSSCYLLLQHQEHSIVDCTCPNDIELLPFLLDMKFGRTEAPAVEKSVVLVVSLMVDQVSCPWSQGVPPAILSGNKGVDK